MYLLENLKVKVEIIHFPNVHPFCRVENEKQKTENKNTHTPPSNPSIGKSDPNGNCLFIQAMMCLFVSSTAFLMSLTMVTGTGQVIKCHISTTNLDTTEQQNGDSFESDGALIFTVGPETSKHPLRFGMTGPPKTCHMRFKHRNLSFGIRLDV